MSHEMTTNYPPRQLSEQEALLLEMLTRESPELVSQIRVALVTEECASCPTLRLATDKKKAQPDATGRRVPAEGEARSLDGAPVHVLLHVDDDGYIRELEVYREDGVCKFELEEGSLTPIRWFE